MTYLCIVYIVDVLDFELIKYYKANIKYDGNGSISCAFLLIILNKLHKISFQASLVIISTDLHILLNVRP